MADYLVLPATTYQAPPPQVRRKGRQLNTIMEEATEAPTAATEDMKSSTRARRVGTADDRLEQWLSPMSDHFPTPRGFHFLAAPILPSSPSSISADETNSPLSSSTNPWKRTSCTTEATDFDDLDIYDDSDDEECLRHNNRVASGSNTAVAKALPRLSIPPSQVHHPVTWSARSDKKFASPVAPTPTAQVPMSPAMMNFMHVQHSLDVPTISAPPSLDGSLTSDQMAQMSAPPTPVIGGQDEEDQDWSGVQLQPGALATLEALSGSSSDVDMCEGQEQVLELAAGQQPPREMTEARQQPLRLITSLGQQRATVAFSPAQQRSLAGLTKLDIPSPGGFFSGLSPKSRHTWHLRGTNATPVEEAAPPTSTTAEQFYKLPWNAEHHLTQIPPPPPPPPRPLHLVRGDFSSSPVEQVLEIEEVAKDDPLTAVRVLPTPEPITARRVSPSQPSGSSTTLQEPPSSPILDEVTPTEIVVDYDPDYARKQQIVALGNLDRTELWLNAQRAYLQGVGEISRVRPVEEQSLENVERVEEKEVSPAVPPKDDEQGLKKKVVRFEDAVKSPLPPRSLPSKLLHLESAYYRAFTDLAVRARPIDAFVHRSTRFESLQAQRVSLRDAHRNQLMGKFQLSVVPQSAKKRMSTNVVRGDDQIIDDPTRLRAEKEAEALAQMALSTWHVAAHKLLNGGRLIAAPVHKRLARMSRMIMMTMMMGSDHDGAGVASDRVRILDLGGLATCDWAWHASLQYPNAKIYSVTTKAIRQLSNSNIRGPPNHRQVAVERLHRLPFADNQFDLVRATELHSILKLVGENGADEWEACLAEIMRVLKPGGYLEFNVLDSDMVNAGPLGNAKNVEFGFALQTLGYDPAPTKTFMGRLSRVGFESPKRAWVCLPVGPRPSSMTNIPSAARDSVGNLIRTVELEAMVTGSTDNVASVTGLAAGWSWERWMLRAEMDKLSGELRLADMATASSMVREAGESLRGLHAIVDEGRACGAAFRMLRGYARKPRLGMGTIEIAIDV